MSADAYYLPEWVARGIFDGSIHHLEYQPVDLARVVFASGGECLISVAVSDEMRAEEREAWRRRVIESGGFITTFRSKIKLDEHSFRGIVYNPGT